MKTLNKIRNYVLYICCRQTEKPDAGLPNYLHKLSIHIQDVIPGFVIEWICVGNDNIWFEGEQITDTGKYVKNRKVYLTDCTIASLTKVYNVLKNIDLFK